MIDGLRQRFLEAILDTHRELALDIIDEALDQGHSPETLMMDILTPVIQELAEIVQAGQDATLAQLYLASQIFSEATDRLVPKIPTSTLKGTVVLGTSVEDFHGLGKKIVGGCLKSRMIHVVDLGLNVSAETFIDQALAHGAQVIGVSSMMVHTARGPGGPIRIRQLIGERNLEHRLRLVVGGAPYRFHPELYREVGADAWADNALTATQVILDLIGEVKQP